MTAKENSKPTGALKASHACQHHGFHIKLLYFFTTFQASFIAIVVYFGFNHITDLRYQLENQNSFINSVQFKDVVQVDTLAANRDSDDASLHTEGTRKRRDAPVFYRDDPRGNSGGTKGEPEDWVWLTSYSRIPVRLPS